MCMFLLLSFSFMIHSFLIQISLASPQPWPCISLSWNNFLCCWVSWVSFFLLSSFYWFFIFFSRPHLQGQVVVLPTLAAPKKDHLQEQTSIAPLERNGERCSDLKAKVSQNREEDWRKGGAAEISSGGWSWTVGESRCTAQWVRQKQEYRGTRPWWQDAIEAGIC